MHGHHDIEHLIRLADPVPVDPPPLPRCELSEDQLERIADHMVVKTTRRGAWMLAKAIAYSFVRHLVYLAVLPVSAFLCGLHYESIAKILTSLAAP